MKLKDKIALVTGSSRGLGKAIALALAENGANIGVNYINEPSGTNRLQANQVKYEIEKIGRKAILLQADVSCQEEVSRMIQEFLTTFSRIDILVNNAGIVRDITLKNMSREDWETVISVNLTGVFFCTSAVINHMREQGSGRIINIASVVGQMGNIGQSNYAASKAGVIGLTKSLAQEVARKGITVNAIAPGFIETDMVKTIPEEIRQQIIARIPLGRFGTPREVAAAVVFLASAEASYITGQVLNVNGGLYM
ncbi:MAG: 3-oxoacyl-[acyl-carrier-protein] reductase [Candidatus Omnitrophica bacterium]|nr:3-oxoacyl-[acyl-carrier-protein] reductase [Candidatus Omnitrophota bacterium]MCM8769117.1 3-oxoacyl-[acyl-carrier-protein] reductase [Candidatus Omnitrophota bacterium]